MPGMKPTPGTTAIHEAASCCGALAAAVFVIQAGCVTTNDLFGAFKDWVLANGDEMGVSDEWGRESFKHMTRDEYTHMIADAQEVIREMTALAVRIRAREVTAQQN